MTEEQPPQGGPATPENFADLVALVMSNSQRLDALEMQLEQLQAWVAAYPPDGAREIFASLVRTEIDEYRKTAEQALRELATAIHDEITALRGGGTTAQEAITALTEEVHDLSVKLDVPADLETKARLSVDLAQRSAEVAKTAQHALLVTLDEFKAYRQSEVQRDTFVDRLMTAERKRQRADRLREARAARREVALRHTIGTLQPVALLILGYISSNGLARLGALPNTISIAADVVIFVAVSLLLLWQGWSGAARALRTGRTSGSTPPRRRLEDAVDDAADGTDEEEEEDDAETHA